MEILKRQRGTSHISPNGFQELIRNQSCTIGGDCIDVDCQYYGGIGRNMGLNTGFFDCRMYGKYEKVILYEPTFTGNNHDDVISIEKYTCLRAPCGGVSRQTLSMSQWCISPGNCLPVTSTWRDSWRDGVTSKSVHVESYYDFKNVIFGMKNK